MIKPTNRSRSLFLAIEAILYFLLLFVSLPLRGGTVHYLSILVVALLAWLVRDSSPRLNFVRIAMLFTVFADLFLTYWRVEQLLGTALFAFAQLAFAGRLMVDETDKRFWIVLRFVVAEKLDPFQTRWLELFLHQYEIQSYYANMSCLELVGSIRGSLQHHILQIRYLLRKQWNRDIDIAAQKSFAKTQCCHFDPWL